MSPDLVAEMRQMEAMCLDRVIPLAALEELPGSAVGLTLSQLGSLLHLLLQQWWLIWLLLLHVVSRMRGLLLRLPIGAWQMLE